MPIEPCFRNIRHIDGSDRSGFEEFCCQVARIFCANTPGTFRRFRPPDKGVECQLSRSNGEVVGWQAKYFINGFDDSGVDQVVKSFKAAIKGNPAIAEYIVCLPIDLTNKAEDPRWKKVEEKCREECEWLNNKVKITLWGKSELIDLISAEEHLGKLQFWFDSQFLSHQWFRNQYEGAEKYAGPRYTPDCHVDLPIKNAFIPLTRSQDFQAYILRQMRNCTTHRVDYKGIPDDLRHEVNEILRSFHALKHKIGTATWGPSSDETLQPFLAEGESLYNRCEEMATILLDQHDKLRAQSKEEHMIKNYSWAFRSAATDLWHMKECLKGTMGQTFSEKVLLLNGRAGKGKTHLLLDIVLDSINEDRPAIVIDGRLIRSPNRYKKEIPELLDLKCTWQEFLSGLDSAGEVVECRALLIIDGLNETSPHDARREWRDILPVIRSELKNYRHIGLCVSYRTEFEDTVIRQEVKAWPLETHPGFDDFTEEAVQKYFDHYDISLPQVPILRPDFSNGLFLRLVCMAAKSQGLNTIPIQKLDFDWLVDVKIDALYQEYSKTIGQNEPTTKNFVATFINLLANEMLKSGRILPSTVVEDIARQTAPSMQGINSLREVFKKESLLSEFPRGDSDDLYCTFSFERLGDYLIAKAVLAEYASAAEFKKAFEPNGAFWVQYKEKHLLYYSAFWEAMCLLVPKRWNIEIVDLSGDNDFSYEIEQAWVNTLSLRTGIYAHLGLLSKLKNLEYSYPNKVNEAILTWIVEGSSEVNYEWLHAKLMKRPLMDRDYRWSVTVEDLHFGDSSIINRILTWTRSKNGKLLAAEDAKKYLTVLAWMTSVPTSIIRECAIKSMVNILSTQPELTSWILENFQKVNDPQILESVSLACYGAVLRETSQEDLRKITEKVFQLFFHQKKPPINSMIRDSLIGILRKGIHELEDLSFDEKRISKGFGSVWSLDGVPSVNDLKQKTPEQKEYSARAEVLITSTLQKDNFLERIYGIPSISGRPFVKVHRNSRRKRLPIEKIDHFRSKFGHDDLKKLDALADCLEDARHLLIYGRHKEDFNELLSAKGAELAVLEEALGDLTGRCSRAEYQYFVKFHLESVPVTKSEPIDNEDVRRWVVNRVFELGYPSKKIKEADELRMRMSDSGRHHGGLYGVKYLNIAHKEARARLADNYLADSGYEGRITPYEVWLNYERFCDPSIVSFGSEDNGKDKTFVRRHCVRDQDSWLSTDADLPGVEQDIEISMDGHDWFAIHHNRRSSHHESLLPNSLSWNSWRGCQALVYEKADRPKILEYYSKTNLWSSWKGPDMSNHDCYLGELGWAKSTERSDGQKVDQERPATIGESEFSTKSMHVLWSKFSTEESVAYARQLVAPSRELISYFGLRYVDDAVWADQNGVIVAFDPAGLTESRSMLLVRKDFLESFLRERDLEIAWQVQQEKIVTSDDNYPRLERCGIVTLENGKIFNRTLLVDQTTRKLVRDP